LRSRMREMFNLISFPNDTPDKRKWKFYILPLRGDLEGWKSQQRIIN
jgi:hypothetical protein